MSYFEYYPANPSATHRIFCFPFAAGNPSMFATWSKKLPAHFEVIGICFPGRGRRLGETPFSDIKDLIIDLGTAIRPLLGKPYYLYGHSLGGNIAYELVQYLFQHNLSLPLTLFPAASAAPGTRDGKIPTGSIPHKERNFEQMIALLKQYGATPLEILENTELMEMLIPYIQADFVMSQEYMHYHENPVPVPITYFHGSNDDMMTKDQPSWKNHTSTHYKQINFEAGHFFNTTHTDLLLAALTTEFTD